MRDLTFFDIESTGLVIDETSEVHCICTENLQGEKHLFSSRDNSISKGFQFLIDEIKKGNCICGHNIIGFDLPYLQHCTGIEFKRDFRAGVIDTLVCSRLGYPNLTDFDSAQRWIEHVPDKLSGSHKLEAWGWRLGNHKIEFSHPGLNAWAELTDDMITYCAQDVSLTKTLYEHLAHLGLTDRALRLEHDAAWVCCEIEKNGYGFDIKSARELEYTLRSEHLKADGIIKATAPQYLKKTFIPKRDNAALGYKKDEPVLVYSDFNAGSPKQLNWLLTDYYQYIPVSDDFYNFDKETGQKRSIKTSYELWESILEDPSASEELKEMAGALHVYKKTQKLLGMLSEGDSAWLKLQKNGVLHHRINPNGAVTGRASHSSPNLAQVPAVGKLYGAECRALFGPTDKGWLQVGVDASGLELRCLAHYLYRWDKGAYAHEILNGDIHTANQMAAGLATRNEAKTFIYAFLYGGGDQLIGRRLGGDSAKGREVKAQFLEKTPAIANLKNAIEETLTDKALSRRNEIVWKRDYLKGLDGRKLHVRRLYSALNLLLQSAGALVCKQWLVNVDKALYAAGYTKDDYKIMGWIHDEIQVAVKDKETGEAVITIAIQAIKETGESFEFKCPLDAEGKIGRNWAETH